MKIEFHNDKIRNFLCLLHDHSKGYSFLDRDKILGQKIKVNRKIIRKIILTEKPILEELESNPEIKNIYKKYKKRF